MKIVVCGNYGAQNLGDELILDGLLATLKVAAPAAEITVMSGNPEETTRKHGVKSVAKFPAGFRSVLKNLFSGFGNSTATTQAVRDCDYFILGGGGLFNDLDWHASIIWYMQARQAVKYGKPLIMYGQSIGPLSDVGKFLVKRIFQKAVFIGVRDEDSAIELKNLGVDKEIIVMPDLAFRLPAATTASILNSQIAATPQSIVISLRQLPTTDEKFITEFATFCNWLVDEQKLNLEFIDFQQGPHGDHNLHQKIIAKINQKEKTAHLDNLTKTAELLDHLQEADFVFAMRLHAIISAMKAGKPFLALSYSKKINSLIKDAGLEKYLISHNNIYADQLKNFFLFLKEKKSEIQEKLMKINVINLEKLEKAELRLKDLLK